MPFLHTNDNIIDVIIYVKAITKWQILYANYESDVGDWNELPHNSTKPPPEWEIDRLDHCSALVRMTGRRG